LKGEGIMAFIVNEYGVMFCSNCKVTALRKRDYLEDLHSDDPEYFFEPFDDSDNYLFVCPKCKNEDFPF
jgi:predicted nucleic-acid-binding Zn-ribbon protein